ncbi:uncharacterized protein LOC117223170 isoform X1 [Megalopta genalis]|uniref:uncharacterized protein LOC117223170 isoform X1 n=1 Tax=Megalopta genalis TaxID=115081 RepID=UPI003FD2B80B
MSNSFVERDVTETSTCYKQFRIKRRLDLTSSELRHNIVKHFSKKTFPSWILQKHSLRPLRIYREWKHLFYKLKADLQDLGLSRRLVHRGLIQLATKPRVVLTREPTARRYGPRRLYVNENEDKSSKVTDRCTTDIEVGECHLQPAPEFVHESVTMDTVGEKKYKQNEKVDAIRSYKTVSESCSQTFKAANTQSTLQSFDKALEQLDMINFAKRSVIEKSINKKTCVSPDTTMKTQDCIHNRTLLSNRESLCIKAKNLNTHIQKDVKYALKKAICSKSNEALLNSMLTQNQKNPTKENLSSNSNKIDTDIKIDYKSSKVKHSTEKNVESKTMSNIVSQKDSTSYTDVHLSTSKSYQKRKSLDPFSGDVVEKKKLILSRSNISGLIDKRKWKKLKKFRKYFGNCMSVSEDEQEQTILHRYCKNKKNLIDSCDSGVCFSDGSVTANFEEKSKQTGSVPDSTMQEEFNEDTSKKNLVEADNIHQEEDDRNETITSANETENTTINIIISGSNNSEAEITKANTQSNTDKTTEETTSTENAKETLQWIEASEADSSSIDTEIMMSPGVCYTFKTEHGEYDIQNLSTTDFSDIQEDNLNSDFNELLQMTFDSTCQIKSNGNVVSIQENVTKDLNQIIVKDDIDLSSSDENWNLETFAERELDSKGDQENDDIPLRGTVISINSKMTIKTENELVNDTMCSMLDNVNETASQKSELERTVKKKESQSNQSFQGRLRVLSSAELGSRWCPTPIRTDVCIDVITSVSQAVSTASKNLPEPVTNTPASLPTTCSVTVPVSTEATVPLTNATQSNFDSESVDKGLVMICNLIKSIRSSPLISISTYDNALYTEFDKLWKGLKPVNFPTLLNGIIKLINKKEFETMPVTLHEIFCYTPSLQNVYTEISSSQVCNVNDLCCNICCLSGTAIATNKTTVQQNVQWNYSSLDTGFQESVARNAMPQQRPVHFNQTSINPKSVQGSEKIISQSHNVPQSDTPISNVIASQSSQPSKVRKQRVTARWKTSHTANQKSVSNRNVAQSIPRQQQVPNPSANANEARKYMYIPTLNGYVNYPHVTHNVGVSETNTFYDVGTTSTTNYPTAQSMNPVYTMQPQNINLPYNVQSQNINSKYAFQSRNINSTDQHFPKTVSQPSTYNIVHRPRQMHGAQLSQNTTVANYPPTTIFGPNNQQPILRNVLQNEEMYQQIQMQPPHPPPYPQNFAKPTTVRGKKQLHSKDHAMITGNSPQVSLVSTAKNFNILKHLSDIQKIILLKQINFYFGCTIWLEQEFTQMKWQKVQSERTMLLNFHTLLKHLVDKILHDLSQNKYQSVSEKNQTIRNVDTDAPEEPQITVEGSGAHCKVDVSHGKKVQSNATACVLQQNLNGAIVQNQPNKGPEIADTPENTEYSGKAQKSEYTVRDQKDNQGTVQKNTCPRPVSLLETETVLKDTENVESGIERNWQDSTEKQHSSKPEKVPENSSNSVKEEALNLVESNKDKSLQMNSHLVTVLISPDSDHVTVVDIVKSHEVTENVFKTMDTEITKDSECSQNERLNLSAEDSMSETLSKNSDTNSESSQNVFVIEEEETCSTQIADVRSISLKTFEEMGLGSCTSTVFEENIIEEEIKVCLCCSKLSTVVCSLCLEAKYCSKECSELHWPEHYKICKLV